MLEWERGYWEIERGGTYQTSVGSGAVSPASTHGGGAPPQVEPTGQHPHSVPTATQYSPMSHVVPMVLQGLC